MYFAVADHLASKLHLATERSPLLRERSYNTFGYELHELAHTCSATK
ncbi:MULTISPECIES: hypothetical protein [Nostoc]|uniref:Uncharacterized protein n=1 Tax=Nostoc paludosum FACHB-159 TaxID=2692908 RepID=A0ABR8KG66_9NOSO|nr:MULTISPECIES: hypothetical protein [Nostoc]MBD2682216.1 hypothetical protein [Nostoc sp. FACHB-857]MBD2738545.1 hypothetical protein [Nostoc paludosum FACHB-159]